MKNQENKYYECFISSLKQKAVQYFLTEKYLQFTFLFFPSLPCMNMVWTYVYKSLEMTRKNSLE